ncbi:MAG: MarR family transcriptional regulator [Alphaproteobacteria bacterium]|nr:MAG: MarR family transcriptional regulator [Alphaproteobacteria bacterium]
MRLPAVGRLFLREETLKSGFLGLLAAARRLEDRIADRARQAGLSAPAALVLIAIWAEPGIDRKGLERWLARTRPTLAPLVAELTAAGLIEKRRPPSDRRRRGFHVTPAGAVEAERCFAAVSHLLRQAFREEGEEAVAGFLALLRRLAP